MFANSNSGIVDYKCGLVCHSKESHGIPSAILMTRAVAAFSAQLRLPPQDEAPSAR